MSEATIKLVANFDQTGPLLRRMMLTLNSSKLTVLALRELHLIYPEHGYLRNPFSLVDVWLQQRPGGAPVINVLHCLIS